MRCLMSCTVPFALLAGCITGSGGDDEPEKHRVTFTLGSIVVRAPCDEFPINVDGGEWSHRLTIRFPGEAIVELGGTANYPNAGSIRNAGAGDALAINANQRTQTREIDDDEDNAIELHFAATEWDYDIFGGNPTPDSRMNNRFITREIAFSEGNWPNQPNATLVLQNTADCRVDVSYSFTAEKL